MTKIAFRSPVEVPLLRFGQPKPPGLPLNATFRVTKRSQDPDPGGPGGKHLAIDIGNFDCGAPIVAMAPGTAHRAHDEAKADGAATNALGVRISHGSGVVTEYWHFSSFVVLDGAKVKAGDRIGRVGKTGNADACHCHIELKVNNVRKDPEAIAFGATLTVSGRAGAGRGSSTAAGGSKVPLTFKAADYRPITNRKFVTDIKANFRAAPNTAGRIIKQFPGNKKVIPSGVVKGQAITGGSPRTGFKPTDWFEARMKVGTKVELGYFHCSVLTDQEPVE
jgi:murein DD-endopeptidase MepM/ murein hydrolase activator NlpD